MILAATARILTSYRISFSLDDDRSLPLDGLGLLLPLILEVLLCSSFAGLPGTLTFLKYLL